MIAHMLANLLQNAVTHGTAGNRITLTLSKGPSGPALAAADRDKVFDAVYRADAARSNAGNGLGLTLVKSIADRHGAQITLADTAPGLSVTVQFTHA
jgi:signal transduction histidine kinase